MYPPLLTNVGKMTLDIVPEPGFELQATLAIEPQVPCQPRPIFTEPLTHAIASRDFESTRNSIEEVAEM